MFNEHANDFHLCNPILVDLNVKIVSNEVRRIQLSRFKCVKQCVPSFHSPSSFFNFQLINKSGINQKGASHV